MFSYLFFRPGFSRQLTKKFRSAPNFIQSVSVVLSNINNNPPNSQPTNPTVSFLKRSESFFLTFSILKFPLFLGNRFGFCWVCDVNFRNIQTICFQSFHCFKRFIFDFVFGFAFAFTIAFYWRKSIWTNSISIFTSNNFEIESVFRFEMDWKTNSSTQTFRYVFVLCCCVLFFTFLLQFYFSDAAQEESISIEPSLIKWFAGSQIPTEIFQSVIAGSRLYSNFVRMIPISRTISTSNTNNVINNFNAHPFSRGLWPIVDWIIS